MNNQITLKKAKDAFPIASIILALYLVLKFTFSIIINIINYHQTFDGMISNITADVVGMIIPSILTIAIIVLPILKVRGPWLAIPFALFVLLCVFNIFRNTINLFTMWDMFRFNILPYAFYFIRSAVSIVAYLLMGIAALKSAKVSKPIWSTLASVLLLINALTSPITNFLSSLYIYFIYGEGFTKAFEWAFEDNFQLYRIMNDFPPIIFSIIFAVGMFFLGRWMAKGKPQAIAEEVTE